MVSLLCAAGCLVFFLMGLVRPLMMMSAPTLIGYNEGWNAGHAARLMQGLPLYPGPEELVTNNYPPLSFLFYAAIGSTGVDLIYTGRILSFLFFLSSAALVFFIARRLNCRPWAAALGALALLATITRFFPYYVGMNEPQWMAHAVMLAGLAVFIKAQGHRALVLAAALMLMAGLIKHNLIGIPLSCTIWLAITDRKRFAVFFAAGLCMAAASIALMQAFFGDAIWHNLINARIMSVEKLLRKLEHVLAAIAPLGLWFGTLALGKGLRTAPHALLLSLMLAFGLGEVLLFGAGDGVAANVVFDLVIAGSLGIAYLAEQFASGKASDKAVMLLCLLVFVQIASWPNFRYLKAAYDPGARDFITGQGKAMVATISAIQRIDGTAWCEHPSLCYWAGKSFVFDKYNTYQRLSVGGLKPEDVARHFDEQKVKALQFDERDVKPRNVPSAGDSILAPLVTRMDKDISANGGFGSVLTRKAR